MKHCLSVHKLSKKIDILLLVLQVFKMLPIATKNSVEQVEEILNDLIQNENREVANFAQDVFF
jgi:hypothetical protein